MASTEVATSAPLEEKVCGDTYVYVRVPVPIPMPVFVPVPVPVAPMPRPMIAAPQPIEPPFEPCSVQCIQVAHRSSHFVRWMYRKSIANICLEDGLAKTPKEAEEMEFMVFAHIANHTEYNPDLRNWQRNFAHAVKRAMHFYYHEPADMREMTEFNAYRTMPFTIPLDMELESGKKVHGSINLFPFYIPKQENVHPGYDYPIWLKGAFVLEVEGGRTRYQTVRWSMVNPNAKPE